MRKMYLQGFCHAGACHDRKEELCQDQLYKNQEDGIAVMVLCDGAGSFSQGGQAAKLCGELIGPYLQKHFERLLIEDGTRAKREIAAVIENGLKQYAMEQSLDVGELAATMMAAAMDEQGRIVGFHLGDGCIWWRDEDQQKWKVMSSPENGARKNTTFLTMNCHMMSHLRFFRWNRPGIRQICMMTDGLYEMTGQIPGVFFAAGKEQDLEDFILAQDPYDDCSYGILDNKYPLLSIGCQVSLK